MSLWADRRYYQDVMSPDEEAEWAEHDRRCGHTPSRELGTSLFSPTRRTDASPSASGLLLLPLGGPDASPSKEAA